MGNVSLKVLEKSLNFLFKNGYEPCMTQHVLSQLILHSIISETVKNGVGF